MILWLPVLATFSAALSEISRRDKLPFLDVHGPARFAGLHQQISLPAKEGGNLQDIRCLGGGSGLRRFVDVGQDRDPEWRTSPRMRRPSLSPGRGMSVHCCGSLYRTTP